MTKCVMRELENLSKEIGFKNTLLEAQKVIKESCKHPGGILPPDECIKQFIGKKNEVKMFVGTNDEELRNELRNLGTVPIFFMKHNILIMDSPNEITQEKHRMVCVILYIFIERTTEERTDETREEIPQGIVRRSIGVPQAGKGKRGQKEKRLS